MKTSVWCGATTLLVGMLSVGCLVNDNANGSRGQSPAPAANVPDAGSPIRRESPTQTLNGAEAPAPADADLKVGTPPPAK